MLGGSSPEIRIRVRVTELENISKSLRSVETQISGFANALGVQFKGVNTEVKRSIDLFAGLGNMLRVQTKLILGYSVIRTVGQAISGAAGSLLEFDRILREVQAITRASSGDMEILSGAIMKVFKSSTLTFSEIGKATKVLGQAGLSAQQVANTLESVAKLAIATGSNIADVAQLMTTAIKVFNVDAKKSSSVANTFAVAINKSKLTLDSLRIAFAYVAPIAAQTGESIQSVTALMGVLADKGLQASKIGTSLRQVFASLMKPSARFKSILQEVGLTYDDINLKTHRLIDILETFKKVGIDITDIYYSMGVRAATGLAYLIDSVKQVRLKETLLKDKTALEEMYRITMSAVTNTFANLRNQFLALIASTKKDIVPTLINISQGMLGVLQASKWLAGGLFNIRNRLATVGTVMGLIITRFNPMIGAITAASSLIAGLGQNLGLFKGSILSARDAVYLLTAALTFLISNPFIRGIMLLGEGLTYISSKVKELQGLPPIVGEVSKSVKNLREAVNLKEGEENRTLFANLLASFEKMKNMGVEVDKVFDLDRLRAVVESPIFDKSAAREWLNKNKSGYVDFIELALTTLRKVGESKLKEIQSKPSGESALDTLGLLGIGQNIKPTKQATQRIKSQLAGINVAIKWLENEKKKVLTAITVKESDKPKGKAVFLSNILEKQEKEIKDQIEKKSAKTLDEYIQMIRKQKLEIDRTIQDFAKSHQTVVEIMSGKLAFKAGAPAQVKLQFVKMMDPLLKIYQRLIQQKRELEEKANKEYKNIMNMTKVIPTTTSQLNTLIDRTEKLNSITNQYRSTLNKLVDKEIKEYIKNNQLTIDNVIKLNQVLVKHGLNAKQYVEILKKNLEEGINQKETLSALIREYNKLSESTSKLNAIFGDTSPLVDSILNKIISLTEEGKISIEELDKLLNSHTELSGLLKSKIDETKGKTWEWSQAFKQGISSGIDEGKSNIETFKDFWANTTKELSSTFEEGFVDVMKGDFDNLASLFQRFTQILLSEWMHMIARMMVHNLFKSAASGGGLLSSIGGLIGGIFGGGGKSSGGKAAPLVLMAKEGGITPGNFMELKKFAYGSPRVDNPTFGLFGEAGPEAVVPLPDGRHIPVKQINQQNDQPPLVVNLNIQALDASTFQDWLKTGGWEVIENEMANKYREGGLTYNMLRRG